jgi:hypothetical protein
MRKGFVGVSWGDGEEGKMGEEEEEASEFKAAWYMVLLLRIITTLLT